MKIGTKRLGYCVCAPDSEYLALLLLSLDGRAPVRSAENANRSADVEVFADNSIPVGGATMVRLLAQQVDVMILSWLTNLRTVGLFSGPYRISMALRFIPQTLAIPLYPMYSRLAVNPEAKQALHSAYERSVKFFVLAGFR